MGYIAEWANHIIGAALVAALSAAITLAVKSSYWRNLKSQYQLRRLLRPPKRRDEVAIVLPHRKTGAEHEDPRSLHADFVTYEDMLACNYVERSLNLAGWTAEKTQIVTQEALLADPGRKAGNLVLICSPKSNAITGEVIKTLRERIGLGCGFEQSETDTSKITLHFAGQAFPSPSYEQADALIAVNRRPYDGTLNDFALLAYLPNPWNSSTNVLIVAGMRAIGTWAAACALRESAAELLAQTHGKHFTALIHCTYQNWKVSFEIRSIATL